MPFGDVTISAQFDIGSKWEDLAWAMDIWDAEGPGADPKKIMIEYTKEVMVGEELSLCYAFEGDKMYLQGRHGEDVSYSIIMSL